MKKMLFALFALFSLYGNLLAQNGGVLRLDGNGDYVSFDSAPEYPATNFTFEAWIQTTSSDVENEILGWGHTSGDHVTEFRIQAGKLQVGIFNSTSWQSVIGKTNVNTGEWTHVAVVKTGSSIALYVNGVSDATGTISNSPTVDRICIGSLYKAGSFQSGYEFPGQIDEVRIWQNSLDAAEIVANMNTTLIGNETGLIGLWNMDESPGTGTVYDATSNANNGTLQGNAGFAILGAPEPPSGFYAIALNGAVELQWNANSEEDIAYYKIYRNISDDPGSSVSIGISNVPDTIFNDVSVVNGTLYYYWVTAVNDSSVESMFSHNEGAVPYKDWGNALNLDGNADYVSFDISPAYTDTFTVEARIKTTFGGVIFRWLDNDWVKFEILDGKLTYKIDMSYPREAEAITGNINVNDGIWTHVAAVKRGKNISLYVDGVLDVSGSYSFSPTGGDLTTIGAYVASFGTMWGFNGKIDEVRMWDIARDPADIAADINASLRGDENGLSALWHMNEPNSTATSYNSVPGGIDGALNGDAHFTSALAASPPFGLYAIALSDTVELHWGGEGDISLYKIFRNTSDDAGSADSVGATTAPSTSFSDINVDNGTLYYYWVKGVNVYGYESDFSSSDAAVPNETLGNVLALDGDDDYVSSSLYTPSPDFTLEAWIKTTSSDTENDIVGWGTSSYFDSDYMEFRTHEGKLQFVVSDRWEGNHAVTGNTDVNTGVWTHVAVVKDDTVVTLYVNGIADATKSGVPGTGLEMLAIGNFPEDTWGNSGRQGYEFPGRIDEVRIWEIARSSAEIAADMNRPLRGDENGLKALWHFDESPGIKVAYNAKPGGPIGHLEGGAVFTNPDAPEPPSGLFAIALDQKVELYWNASKENDISHYKIYRNISNDHESAGAIGTSNVPDTSFIDLNIDNGTLYYYWVNAVNVSEYESPFYYKSDAALPTSTLGNSLALDGNWDFVTFDSVPIFPDSNNNLTIEAWIKPDSSNDANVILGWSPSAGGYSRFAFRTKNEKLEIDAYWQTVSGTTEIITGNWTHVAVVKSGLDVTLYVNGVLDATGSITQFPGAYDRICIGALYQEGFSGVTYESEFPGKIDEVRIWGVARSVTDIVADMNRPLRGDEDDLEALWHFDEPNGTGTAYDAASGAFDGVLQGDADFDSETVVGVNDDQIPNAFSLSQNFPNPFNPSTTINFALPMPVSLNISVFNILGEKVVELLNSEIGAGFHNVVWNGRNSFGYIVPTGVYIYRLSATSSDGTGDFTKVMKMLFIK